MDSNQRRGFAPLFSYGDRVRLVQNEAVKAQVINERAWGQQYEVRVAATAATMWFEACELEDDPDFAPPVGGKKTPDDDEPIGDGDGAKIIDLAKARAAGRG